MGIEHGEGGVRNYCMKIGEEEVLFKKNK